MCWKVSKGNTHKQISKDCGNSTTSVPRGEAINHMIYAFLQAIYFHFYAFGSSCTPCAHTGCVCVFVLECYTCILHVFAPFKGFLHVFVGNVCVRVCFCII